MELIDKIQQQLDANHYVEAEDIQKLIDAQKWVAVEDRLPERFQNVIGWNRANNRFCTGQYTMQKKNCIGLKTDIKEVNEFDNIVPIRTWVTHWKPLPEPPTV